MRQWPDKNGESMRSAMIVPLLQTTANRWRLLSPVSLPISRVPWCSQLFTLLILKCQQNDSIMRDARGAVCRVSNQLETGYHSPHTRLEGVPSNKFERASSKQVVYILQYHCIAFIVIACHPLRFVQDLPLFR